ncbi:hypothetical protein VNO77_22720 [Canavalia gladiata]|uniref:Uncharacterized protein n=1 Tax=Canavalia gladiata TaxID=3824 RepID=A0AAN9QB19_CANGL
MKTTISISSGGDDGRKSKKKVRERPLTVIAIASAQMGKIEVIFTDLEIRTSSIFFGCVRQIPNATGMATSHGMEHLEV